MTFTSNIKFYSPFNGYLAFLIKIALFMWFASVLGWILGLIAIIICVVAFEEVILRKICGFEILNEIDASFLACRDDNMTNVVCKLLLLFPLYLSHHLPFFCTIGAMPFTKFDKNKMRQLFIERISTFKRMRMTYAMFLGHVVGYHLSDDIYKHLIDNELIIDLENENVSND
jgi:hypothetical protein